MSFTIYIRFSSDRLSKCSVHGKENIRLIFLEVIVSGWTLLANSWRPYVSYNLPMYYQVGREIWLSATHANMVIFAEVMIATCGNVYCIMVEYTYIDIGYAVFRCGLQRYSRPTCITQAWVHVMRVVVSWTSIILPAPSNITVAHFTGDQLNTKHVVIGWDRL